MSIQAKISFNFSREAYEFILKASFYTIWALFRNNVIEKYKTELDLENFCSGYLVLDLVYSEVEFVLGEDRGLAQRGL